MDEVKRIYGLLGEKLGHSYSKVIHELIEGEYNLFEVSKENFDAFMTEKKFDGINVTIPYKEMVIKYLDFIDEKASSIGAVNTIINKNGKLYGYNTDYDGFKFLAERVIKDPKNANCLILGTGGTSKTSYNVLKDLNVKTITKASRSARDGAIKYSDIDYSKYNYVINTTPVGMYPNIFDTILPKGINLEGIIDVIYNPYRTKLLSNYPNVRRTNGLDMLVYQAIKSHEYFIDKEIGLDILNDISSNIRKNFLNIVLIGMPGSGKSSIGFELSKILNMNYLDTDTLIEEENKTLIPEIFAKYGETGFRERESEVIRKVSLCQRTVISTGGGVILSEENMINLMTNGIIVYIKRDLEKISLDNAVRPLSKSYDDLCNLFAKRKEIYEKYSDIIVYNNDILENSIKILKDKLNEFFRRGEIK